MSAPAVARPAAPRPGTTVGLAVGTTVASSLPVFLISALFVNISDDVSTPVGALGALVGAYWLAAAASSTVAGRVGSVIGTRALSLTSNGAAVISLLGIGVWVPEWHWLFLWAVVGGAATGFGHPASNHLIHIGVPERRRALAYGIKQAAVPLASVIAGLTVPALAVTVGWQFAFGAAAVLAAILTVAFLRLVPRQAGAVAARRRSVIQLGAILRRRLILLASVTTLAAGASTATVAFAVTAATDRGIPVTIAGVLMAVASLLSAAARVIVGAFGIRGRGGALGTVAILQALGAVGLFVMAASDGIGYIVGFLIAVTFGWGWPGLMHYVVSSMSADAAPAATGIVSTGTYMGNATAPFVIGFVYHYAGDATAWIVLGIMLVVASAVAWVASRLEAPPVPVGPPT